MGSTEESAAPKTELFDLLVDNSKSARDSLLTPQQNTMSDGFEMRANLRDTLET